MVNIVLNYEKIDQKLYTYANSEKDVDFRRDLEGAEKCTLSFAGLELLEFLTKMGVETTVSQFEKEGEFNIFLESKGKNFRICDYFLSPVENGVKIVGESRTGALYGAYEFLKLQGVKFLNPWQDVVPKKLEKIVNVKSKKVFKPSFSNGRGFYFQGGYLKDSTKFFLWMARNRLNFGSGKRLTTKFQKKLGMILVNGGHIFENILNPRNKTEQGELYFDAHRDWYGYNEQRAGQIRYALGTQFCMTNESLCDFLTNAIIKKINTDWYDSDNIILSTFDTWGRTCMCENCQKLGNGSDKMLNFIAGVRKRLDKAYKDGVIDHNIKIEIYSYEGTSSLQPPENGVPEILKKSGDYACYWPIVRCYEHTFDDDSCSYNKPYYQALSGWKDIPMSVGEYYNVSKFEDLPLLFTTNLNKDLQIFKNLGVCGMTYMHVPILHWGIRNLTQSLYAELCWNVNTDVKKFVKEYYVARYGKYASKIKKAYDLIEKASLRIMSWRAWKTSNVLYEMQCWGGQHPDHPLVTDDHIENAVEESKEIVKNLQKAYDIIISCWQEEFNAEKLNSYREAEGVVNPAQMEEFIVSSTTSNLEEDLAGLRYGLNVAKLTAYMVEYRDLICNGKDTKKLWPKIDKLAIEMSQTYMPLTFLSSEVNVELKVHDQLTRSQYKTLYYRIKTYENEKKMKSKNK